MSPSRKKERDEAKRKIPGKPVVTTPTSRRSSGDVHADAAATVSREAQRVVVSDCTEQERRRFPAGQMDYEASSYSRTLIITVTLSDSADGDASTYYIRKDVAVPQSSLLNIDELLLRGITLGKKLAAAIKAAHRPEPTGPQWSLPSTQEYGPPAVPYEPNKTYAEPTEPSCQLCGDADSSYPVWGPCPHQRSDKK